MSGENVATCADERLVTGEEVPNRWLRRLGQSRGVPQSRVEGVEVDVLMLGPELTLPADVQADLVDCPPVDQPPRQVGRAVGHDRDVASLLGCSDYGRLVHRHAPPNLAGSRGMPHADPHGCCQLRVFGVALCGGITLAHEQFVHDQTTHSQIANVEGADRAALDGDPADRHCAYGERPDRAGADRR